MGRAERVFPKIMGEQLPKLTKVISLEIQEAEQIGSNQDKSKNNLAKVCHKIHMT